MDNRDPELGRFRRAREAPCGPGGEFKPNNDVFDERRRLENLPFKSLTEYLDAFLSTCSDIMTLKNDEIVYFLWRRLQGKYRKVVEAHLEVGDHDVV